MKIILISGKAESGKSTLAKYLKEKLEAQGKKVVCDLFAKYIKAYAMQLGWDGKTKNDYWRSFLQEAGTELIQGKLNKKTFHPARVIEDIEILSNLGVDYFIIDDCRFKREIHYTKAIYPEETIALRINRLGFESSLTPEQKAHKSETDLDNFNFDYTIYCQSGVQHLYDEAERILKKYIIIN